uniref:SHSP domain-containing protein n=1 Tax=Solanum lycopersicum TaxID=4081 RepID=A0A3Q7I4H0_SOLLC
MAKIELEGAGDGQVRTLEVEIHPAGVKMIVVTKGNADGEDEHELNVDTYWRYRLTTSTMPELVTVVFVDGDLIVMVPKYDQGRRQFDNGSRVV